ncbi:thiol-disulfide isomerase/thioredoxin [Halarchaeum rubridurum]|uniref:Thiol-disulfide isomerase/thioredoxin n=1 Tax=Halarchaeum rubridurum TaxID=489911 RepID=A0A830FKM6_9EURY|nr:thioredoxin family protein [Halarchaeum rubridurum]MBP1954804.1 thiol-disulfide isomerase/thioredoxin [Halarchaeum rubridurum]GGM59880.1 hypothetical protein GCM10009017_07540 [Halarchaeum rubridurum]
MSAHTDPAALYERLRDEGLFEESDEEVRLSDAFAAARERERAALAARDDDAIAALRETYTADGDVEPDGVDERTLADAVAVHETCESVDPLTSLHVARSLARDGLDGTDPHVPDGFVSLDGDEIGRFLDAHAAAVVYCWREDCEPCDAVRADLDALRDEGVVPDAVGLGAVYGPDNVDELRDGYEVGAAPTVLFCAGDTVASRFVGNPGREALRRELELLVEEA